MSNYEGSSMAYRPKKSSAGFTIAELLISLTIMALLLAAVAAAFNASVVNYRDNEDIFKTINKARQALTRITNQLRTADAVDPNAPSNQCSLITASSEDITYRYDNSDNKLYLDFNSNSYVLCDNVTAMTFTKDTATEDSVTYVKSVQVSMTVTSGELEKTVSAAAVVRRNLD
ncbi:MAG: prepilin-type N-terminal cleavage/methylation domain-containing protein [Planctomycetota bacterium]|nr:MAG: prepilin-type N-terminal cleavage/methylation domain-containing protein [Planctomycetota bacterium]